MLTFEYKKLLNGTNKTLDKTNSLFAKLQQAVANDDEQKACDLSLDYERTVEKLVAQSRDVVLYNGNSYAQAVMCAINKYAPVDISYTKEGWLLVSIPALLPKKEKGNSQYIREIVRDALYKYCRQNDVDKFDKCVLVFEHVYDYKIPKRQWRDHDNIEVNTVSDMIALFLLRDDSAYICSHFYYSKAGKQNRTNIYVVPDTDFAKWCEQKEVFNDTSK